MTPLEPALNRLYDKHRIVIWYDERHELRAEFEALVLPDVEKIVVENNQFGIKYRILREQPRQKFLLYHPGPRPADSENWLLDVELAQGLFAADQAALWLNELGLPAHSREFRALAERHAPFFRSAERRAALKGMLSADDTPATLPLRLAAVCAGTDAQLESILHALLSELAAQEEQKWQLIARCNLAGPLWAAAERAYGYQSTSRSVRDFALKLFESSYRGGALNVDARVLLQRWRDNRHHEQAFRTLSADMAQNLAIRSDLEGRDLTALPDLTALAAIDLFELVDQRLLSELVGRVAARTIDAKAVHDLVSRRRTTHWYADYTPDYAALEAAADLLAALPRLDLTMRDLADGVRRYAAGWHEIDRCYRHVIANVRRSGRTTLFQPLLDEIETRYIGTWLDPLSRQWQRHVDAAQAWRAPGILSQAEFFARRVQPVVERGHKLAVIISDALRYEIGVELLERIRREDRYTAGIEPALTLLPGITALGMAALLPHTALTVQESGEVWADGRRTAGTDQRQAILAAALRGKGAAIQVRDLLQLNQEEGRALVRENQVLYVYHNRIDATGDKRDTEERVFDEVEETLRELVEVVKKLSNANINNWIITADHGFLYQQRPLEEGDFHSAAPDERSVITRNRRWVIGRFPSPPSGFKRWTPAQVGYHGDFDLLLPKGIQRLRVQGAGSRYVHGGATLQEVVIPVIHVNKSRATDTAQVDVQILRGAATLITTGQLRVTLYQEQPVSAKVQPRTLRVGLYAPDGALISDQHELLFDSASPNEREREKPVRLVLTQAADRYNNQEVLLRLEERIPDTESWKHCEGTVRYLLRRSFTTDFDL